MLHFVFWINQLSGIIIKLQYENEKPTLLKWAPLFKG